MQATATLTTTTFLTPVAVSDTEVNLASTSGIAPGVVLFANRELFSVLRLTGIGNRAQVLRGREGTMTQAHSTNETVYIARGDQLYASDPQGVPTSPVLVSPYINVLTGVVWVTQGDEAGPNAGARTWQTVTSTQAYGDLGIRQTTTTTPT